MNLARLRVRLLLAAMISAVPATALASDEAHTNYGAIWNDNKPEKGQPFGCLAGSLGRVKGDDPANRVTMLLRRQGVDNSSQTVTIHFLAGAIDRKSKLMDGKEMRKAFHSCLRPGTYTLLGFHLGSGMTDFSQPHQFAIPVEVKPGQTTYIGSFIGYMDGSPSNCGLSATSTRVEARDREAEDRALIQPMVDKVGHTFVKQMPDLSSGPPLLLTCPPAPVAGH